MLNKIKTILGQANPKNNTSNSQSSGTTTILNPNDIGIRPVTSANPERSQLTTPSAITFKVFRANGGFVVECYQQQNIEYKYDTMQPTPSNLYVVSDNETLSEALARIVVMEGLLK